MKRLSNLLAALVFASLVIFMSCGGGGDDPGPSELEITVQNLTVSGGFSNPTSVTTDGGQADGDWSTFGISFSGTVDGGSYTVSNVPANFGDVWSNGTWTINQNGSAITKTQDSSNGSTETAITSIIGEGTLSLTFSVAAPAARANGIAGSWTFVFN